MATRGNSAQSDRGLARIPMRIILRLPLFVILQAALIFISAGRIDLPRAWVYLATLSAYYSVAMFLLCRHNPELIIQRARGIRADTKRWDKILMPTIVVIGCVQLVVVGLDIGRFQPLTIGISLGVVGLLVYIAASILATWAVIVNPYYESTVRIQKERGHHAIVTGPYRIMRHPGYVAAILSFVAIPLIMGSVFGLVPAAINAILLAIRTSLEDKTLHDELPGYAEYARTVKYRLIPGIW